MNAKGIRTDNHDQDGGRPAGFAQGIIAVAAMFLPTLAFLTLPASLPRLEAHFVGVPGVTRLVPLIVTAPALCMALLSPFAGMLADRYGRRPVLLCAIALFTVCGLLPLVLDDLRFIVATRFGLGIANAALLTLGATLFGDYFSGALLHRWLSINGVAGAAMGTVAILGGGLLADVSWRGPFAVYGLGILMFLFALYALWEPARPQPTAEGEEKPGFPWRPIGSTALCISVIAAVFFVQPVQIGLVLANVGVTSVSTIGLISALASVGVPIGALIYGRLASRPVAALLALALALEALGLAGIGIGRTGLMVGAASFPQQIGNGLLLPTLIHWMQRQAPSSFRARAMGLWTTAFFAGQFLSPWAVSVSTSALGGLQRAVLAASLAALAMTIATLVAWRSRRYAFSPQEGRAAVPSEPLHKSIS